MNMNKILAAGLIAAVASTVSFAECGDGGFYVGVNAGLSFNKAKVKAEGYSYTAATALGKDADGGDVNPSTTNNVNSLVFASKDVASKVKKNSKKTKFLAELVLGYDFRVNDVMMGVDLSFGTQFGRHTIKGKSTGFKDADVASPEIDSNEVESINVSKLKEQWHIGLMPRIGYLFTPEFEGYVTFGVKFAKIKATTIKCAISDIKDGYSTKELADDPYNKSVSKSKMKVIPVVGAGVRYEFTPEMFAKLEYNFDFRTKAKLHKDTMKELKSVKVSAHTIKLGLGYRF